MNSSCNYLIYIFQLLSDVLPCIFFCFNVGCIKKKGVCFVLNRHDYRFFIILIRTSQQLNVGKKNKNKK